MTVRASDNALRSACGNVDVNNQLGLELSQQIDSHSKRR